MAMKDVEILAASMSYTKQTVLGGGAIKGKNCTITSITDIEENSKVVGQRVAFQWTLDDGTVLSDTMDVMFGDDGVGIASITAEGNVMTITYTDGNSDTVTLPTADVNLEDIDDVVITSPSNNQALCYDAATGKWINKTVSGGGGGSAELESDVTSNTAVGAIPSGTTLYTGTTFTEFVQKLLISEVAPTISFTLSKSGNVAYGDSYTETLTVTVPNLGSAKKIKTIAWYQGNTLLQTDTIDSTTTGSWTYTMETATTDTTTFKAIVTYTKSDNTDTSVTKTGSISFYYPKYYGVVEALNPTAGTVQALSHVLATGKGGTYSFTGTAKRIAYAYPKSLGALTSIKDGNGFSLFDSFTRTEQTYTENETSVTYYRYILTDSTTISNYSVTFS